MGSRNSSTLVKTVPYAIPPIRATRCRLWKQGVRDVLMEICCALHNFRLRLTPWQPMV
jgi:hypothetical protein